MQVMETEVKSVARCILRFRRIRPRHKVNGLVETRLTSASLDSYQPSCVKSVQYLSTKLYGATS